MNFINRLVNNVSARVEDKEIPNEIVYDTDSMNWSNIQLTLSSKEERQRLIDSGIDAGIKFLLAQPFNNDLDQPFLKADLDDSVQELSQGSL